MRIAPLANVFRRRSLSLPTAAALDEESLKLGAAMTWINQQGNLDDFPRGRNERMALMATAVRRGLVAWDRGHNRYKLTQLGKTQVACYSPNVRAAPGPAQDSPRPSDRFEGRAPTMMVALLAVAATVGAAAALTSATNSRSPVAAHGQAPGGCCGSDASKTLGAAGSRVEPTRARPQTVVVTASPPPAPTSPPRGEAVTARSAPKFTASQHTREVDQGLQTPPRQEERKLTATITGSVATTRATDHFDRVPSAGAVERSEGATKRLDSQAISEAKPVIPEPKLKPASHHRGRDIKAQHPRIATNENGTQPWLRGVDNDGRPAVGPHLRREPNVAEEPVERGALRYHKRRDLPLDDELPDDPTGLAGWLFR
jgi:hypothetical protein